MSELNEAGSSNQFKQILRDKIAGCLYGFAIGDAMGATTEFMDKEEIRLKYGQVRDIIGGGWLKLVPGEVTDDTQMMQCVINAIEIGAINKSIDEFKHYVMREFIYWFNTNPKDVGNQCSYAIKNYIRTGKFVDVDEDALGNGSLMRSVPLAILGLDELNVEQGRITHNNSQCDRVIQMYSEALRNAIMGIHTNEMFKGPLKSSGYLWDTFDAAIYFGNSNRLYDAIVGPVNNGGDADTIAALSGALAGAMFGLSNMNGRWVSKLNIDTKKMIGKFTDFAVDFVISRDVY